MDAKLCLVTGVTSGIGRGMAHLLAEAGHRVILCARTLEKAEAARETLIRDTGNSQVDVLVADLGDPDSVRSCAEAFYRRHDHLDVLCNMAGATFWKRAETAAGVEMNFAVNHLGSFLLSYLLLDALKAAPQGRIVNVVGEYHRKVSLDFEDLQWHRRKYSAMKAGSAAMLLRVMSTLEMARRLAGTQVTAHCFHPGAVRSNLLRDAPWGIRLLLGWVKIFFLSPRRGADTGFWLAVSPEVTPHSGGYFIRRRVAEPSAEAQDAARAARLWDISCDLLGLEGF